MYKSDEMIANMLFSQPSNREFPEKVEEGQEMREEHRELGNFNVFN